MISIDSLKNLHQVCVERYGTKILSVNNYFMTSLNSVKYVHKNPTKVKRISSKREFL